MTAWWPAVDVPLTLEERGVAYLHHHRAAWMEIRFFFFCVCVRTGGCSPLKVDVGRTLACLQPFPNGSRSSGSPSLPAADHQISPVSRSFSHPTFFHSQLKAAGAIASDMKRPQIPFNVACLERRRGPAGRRARGNRKNICTTPTSYLPPPPSQVAPPPLKYERWGRRLSRTGACQVAEREAGRTDERRKGRRGAS